jgi:outer membrane cobalamin receptor
MNFSFIVLRFFLLLGIVLCNQAFGQNAILKGTITDSGSGNPLSGAHIVVENSKFGAISDYRGAYLISNVPEGDYQVSVTFIGYATLSARVKLSRDTETVLDFRLEARPYLADEAIITANRVEVSRNITPMTVSVVSRQALENDGGSNLLPIVSKQVPGVFVTERGVTGFGVADGAAGQISIRGIGGSPNTQVLVMIDGHPQYMGLFGHPLPDSYIASDAEKVEVIRGPASILYGSNAMGGVINIISRQQAQDGLTFHGKLGLGSFNTLKINAAVGLRLKKFQAFISYNKDKTDGHRENSDFNMDNLYGKVSFDLNSHFRVWTDVSLARYNSTNPGPENTTDTTYDFPTHYQAMERGYASAAIENKYQKSEGALKAYVNWGNHTLAYDDFASSDVNYGFMLYQAMKLFKGNTITAGYDYVRYGGYAYNDIYQSPAVKFIDTTVMETGAYALIQQNIKDRLTLSAGLRLQYHELFKSVWIPQLGASYLAAEYTTVRANISKGYRSPTIRELFMFKPANPNLDPEKMWNYEAGVVQKFLNNRISVDLTGFYVQGDNLIETVGVFPDVQNRNTGSFEHYGIELQGKYLVMKSLDVLANYSWLHTDKPVIAAPKHMVYLEGNYAVHNFKFNLSLQYINNLTTQVSPLITESYALLSARVSYNIGDYLTFYIDGNNLTNQDYEINYDYPMPGIAVMVGMNVNLRKRW